MPAALDKIYRTNRIFSWADGHLNPNRSFVGHLLLGITPQALPIRRSYFVNFVHSVQKMPSLVALARGLGLGFGSLFVVGRIGLNAPLGRIANYFLLTSFSRLLTTLTSSSVVILPVALPVATSSLSKRRMIFPDRVLGSAGVK